MPVHGGRQCVPAGYGVCDAGSGKARKQYANGGSGSRQFSAQGASEHFDTGFGDRVGRVEHAVDKGVNGGIYQHMALGFYDMR